MHADTEKLRQEIRSKTSLGDKLVSLKDFYENETCYILTCGPSIGNYTSEYLKEKLSDKLIISVKQTYDLVPGIVDFHLLNPWNYKETVYVDPEPIVLMSRGENNPLTPNAKVDFLFPVKAGLGVEQESLARNGDFKNYLFESQVLRPYGPGIMYELGFYLAVHLGVKSIITLGWDLGVIDSALMDHFYDEYNRESKIVSGFDSIKGFYVRTKKGIKRKWPPWLVKKLLFLDGLKNKWLRFFELTCGKLNKLLGRKEEMINVRQVDPDECAIIAKSTVELYQWLQSEGVDLAVVSDRSMVDACVPRISL